MNTRGWIATALGTFLHLACAGSPEVASLERALCNCDQPVIPCCCNSPVVIDVGGDGIHLTSWADGVVFALRPGQPSMRAWTRAHSDDAWLVLDTNGDGVINDGSEMFGNMSPQPTPRLGQVKNGFLALSQHDDGDGIVDNDDEVFMSLRLWQDGNHDGVSQSDELRTLPELGVTGISVDYSEYRHADEHHNLFRFRADVYSTPWSTVGPTAWDVWLTSPISSARPSANIAAWWTEKPTDENGCGTETPPPTYYELFPSESDTKPVCDPTLGYVGQCKTCPNNTICRWICAGRSSCWTDFAPPSNICDTYATNIMGTACVTRL